MKTEYAKNASRLHKKIGEILTSHSPWKGFRSEQEVPVSTLFPSWAYGTERYDWVIYDLAVIIECHGIQHYKVQSFGEEAGEALLAFQAQQSRDSKKEEIADLHNWTYIIIPYTDEKKLDAIFLQELYNANKVSKQPIQPKAITPSRTKEETYRQQQLIKAREYRRKCYEQQRDYKKRLQSRNS